VSDHYERLGVPFGATRDEIRIAYRQLARRYHPDASGEASAARMAQINEAWRVLSDPARRAVYDARSRGASNQRTSTSSADPSTTSYGSRGSAAGSSSGHRSATQHDGDWRPAPPGPAPSKFPWRFMLGIAVLGIAFVIVSAALTKPGQEPAPDNLMEVGSCVDILENGDAKEALCSGAYDGVVADLRPVESFCPQKTELHRDRQGMGNICVRLNGP